MKYRLLLCCCTILLLGRSVQASPRVACLPADTLRGEAHLTHLFTEGICAQVAIESRHQDLTVLTNAQGWALLQQVLAGVIAAHLTEFEAFVAQTPGSTVGLQRVSIQAMLNLATACPVAGKLLTQMGAQMAGVDVSQLSSAQKQTLQRVAHAMCEQLTAENTARPFSQRTAEERLAAYYRAVASDPVVAGYQAVLTAFGSEIQSNSQLQDSLWQKIDLLMFDECPAYTAPLRVDRGLRQLRADSVRAAALASPLRSPGAAAPKVPPASRSRKPAQR
jgi:hypothetical protein